MVTRKYIITCMLAVIVVSFFGEKNSFVDWTLLSLFLTNIIELWDSDTLRRIYLGWGSSSTEFSDFQNEMANRRIYSEKLQIICFTCCGYLWLRIYEWSNFEKNLVFKTWWLMLAFILSGLLANYILQKEIFARHIFGETKKSVVNGEYVRLERTRNRYGLLTQYYELSEDVIVVSGDLISEKDDRFYRYKFINNTIYFRNEAHHIEWTTEGAFKFDKDYYVRYGSVLKNGNSDSLRLLIDSYDNLLRCKKGFFWIIVGLSLAFLFLFL